MTDNAAGSNESNDIRIPARQERDYFNPRTAFRLTRLVASGFRCFESLYISLDEDLTVIAGDNGGGKTSVLDLIAASLGSYVTAFQKSAGANLQHESLRLILGPSGLLESTPKGISVAVGCRVGGIPTMWSRELGAAPSSRTTLRDNLILDAWITQIREALVRAENRQKFVLPLVAYYGTGRLYAVQKLTESRKGSGSQTEGYRECLNSGSGYKQFVEWFRKLSYAAAQRQLYLEAQEPISYAVNPAERLDFVSRQVASVLQEHIGVHGIRYDIAAERLLADDPKQGSLPVDQLSDGVRAMLALVGDIAYRIAQLNAHLPAEQLADVPGIVLIDEVDLHLHPTWQQTVLGSLRNTFPNIQWIVTTHSPQVLSTVPKHQIRVLEWEGAKANAVEPHILQTQGIESSEILSQVMGTNPTPPVESAKDLADYRAMVSQGQGASAEALALRARLETHYGAGNQVFQASDVILAWRARQGL